MKQLFEKYFLKYQWLFVITLIVTHIEINYNCEAMSIFLSQIIQNTSCILVINKILTGIIVLSAIFCMLKYFLFKTSASELNKEFYRMDINKIISVLSWLLLLKYLSTLITKVLTQQTFWKCLIDGWYSFYFQFIIILIIVILGHYTLIKFR